MLIGGQGQVALPPGELKSRGRAALVAVFREGQLPGAGPQQGAVPHGVEHAVLPPIGGQQQVVLAFKLRSGGGAVQIEHRHLGHQLSPLGPHRAHHGPGAVCIQGQGGDVILGEAVGELLLPGGQVDGHIRGAVGPLGGQGKAAVGGDGPGQNVLFGGAFQVKLGAGNHHVAGAVLVVQQVLARGRF